MFALSERPCNFIAACVFGNVACHIKMYMESEATLIALDLDFLILPLELPFDRIFKRDVT